MVVVSVALTFLREDGEVESYLRCREGGGERGFNLLDALSENRGRTGQAFVVEVQPVEAQSLRFLNLGVDKCLHRRVVMYLVNWELAPLHNPDIVLMREAGNGGHGLVVAATEDRDRRDLREVKRLPVVSTSTREGCEHQSFLGGEGLGEGIAERWVGADISAAGTVGDTKDEGKEEGDRELHQL